MRLKLASSLIITMLGMMTIIPSMLVLPIVTANYPTAITDAFFLAMVIPTLVSAPLFNAVSSTLVPIIFHARSLRSRQEEELAKSVATILGVTTTLGSILIAIAASACSKLQLPWMASLSGSMVTTFIWWLIPWIFLQAPVTILQSVALTSGKPWLPSLAGLAQQSSIVCLLYGLAGLPGSLGLPLSYIVGCSIQLVLLVSMLPGSCQLLKPSIIDSEALRRLLIASRPVCVGTLVMQAGTVATRFIAAGFGTGTITALECATKLNTTLLDITCTGVLTTCFSRWSELFAQSSIIALRADFLKTIQFIMFTLAPLCVALFAVRVPILVTWLHKLYTIDPTVVILSAELFGVLILSVPLEAAGRLSVRAYLATHQTITPSVLAILRIFLGLSMVLLLTPFLSTLSLAVAESMASLLTLVCLLKWPTNKLKNVMGHVIKTIASMVLPLLIGWLAGHSAQKLVGSEYTITSAVVTLVATLSIYLISSMLINPKGVNSISSAFRLLFNKKPQHGYSQF